MGQKANQFYNRKYYITRALLKNDNFLNDCAQIAEGMPKRRITSDQALELLSRKYLPGIELDDALIFFLLSVTSPKEQSPYYGDYDKQRFEITTPTSGSEEEQGVYIKIFPFTRVEDIERGWNRIQNIAKAHFKNWSKTKEQPNELAVDIVEAYVIEKHRIANTTMRERSKTPLYQIIQKKLQKKHGRISKPLIEKYLKEFSYLKPYFLKG